MKNNYTPYDTIPNLKNTERLRGFHFRVLRSGQVFVDISQEILAIAQIAKCIETAVLTAVAVGIIATEREWYFSKK